MSRATGSRFAPCTDHAAGQLQLVVLRTILIGRFRFAHGNAGRLRLAVLRTILIGGFRFAHVPPVMQASLVKSC